MVRVGIGRLQFCFVVLAAIKDTNDGYARVADYEGDDGPALVVRDTQTKPNVNPACASEARRLQGFAVVDDGIGIALATKGDAAAAM